MRSMLYLVCGFAIFVGGCSRDRPKPLIWLGHLGPLSEERGEQAMRAMQLALEERQKEEFTVAGRAVGVRHVDASAKGLARAEATRLLTVNRVAALLVGPGVAEVDEVVALARGRDTPIVVLDEVADESLAAPAILLGPSPAARGRKLAEYGLTAGKAKRAVIVCDRQHRLCAALALAFGEAWREGGGTVVEFTGDARDRVALTASEPAVVLLALPSEQVVGWLEAHPGLDLPLLYGGPDGDRRAWEGTLRADTAIVEATAYTDLATLSEEGLAWRKRFQDRYRLPPSRAAVLAHDGLELILAGLVATQATSRLELKEDLAGRASFASLTGPLTWLSGVPRRTLYLVRHHGGKRELLR